MRLRGIGKCYIWAKCIWTCSSQYFKLSWTKHLKQFFLYIRFMLISHLFDYSDCHISLIILIVIFADFYGRYTILCSRSCFTWTFPVEHRSVVGNANFRNIFSLELFQELLGKVNLLNDSVSYFFLVKIFLVENLPETWRPVTDAKKTKMVTTDYDLQCSVVQIFTKLTWKNYMYTSKGYLKFGWNMCCLLLSSLCSHVQYGNTL